MLTPEQAQSVLKEAIDENAAARERDAIKSLPKNLRTVTHALFMRQPDGKPYPDDPKTYRQPKEAFEAQEKALQFLTDAKLEVRMQVFTALFPTLSPYVELAWNLLSTLPYQISYTRRGFRAPTRSDVYMEARRRFLQQLHNNTFTYLRDVRWYAEHAAYIQHGYGTDMLAKLFAAAINAGGETGQAIYDILIDSANGEHPVGAMGRHIPRALLIADRQDGWEYVERLLLAAQRQEGLRQVILESADEVHPAAYPRLIRLILDNDLARFSAVTRALNVWLGYMWDSESTVVVNKTLRLVLNLIEDPDARLLALSSGGGEEVYLALYATAIEDAFAAIPLAVALLNDPVVERRYAAVHLLTMLDLREVAPILLTAMEDSDLRVVMAAFNGFRQRVDPAMPELADAFERIEAILPRLPAKETTLEPLIWAWSKLTANRSDVAYQLITMLGERTPKRLMPYFDDFASYARDNVVRMLIQHDFNDPDIRALALKMLGDRNDYLRESLIKMFAEEKLVPTEVEHLESLLTRKSAELRRGMLTLLLRQPDKGVLTSADRLLNMRPFEQRAAGLELLVELVKAKRSGKEAASRAAAYRTARAESLSDAERVLIEQAESRPEDAPTIQNGLGLIDPAKRSQPVAPRRRKAKIDTSAARAVLLSLDELIHEHRAQAFTSKGWQGDQEFLLGNHLPNTNPAIPIAEDAERLPLRELWTEWYQSRTADQRDKDGLELVRASLMLVLHVWEFQAPFRGRLTSQRKPAQTTLTLRYQSQLDGLVAWLMRLYPAKGTPDLLMDAMEDGWAEYMTMPESSQTGAYIYTIATRYLSEVRSHFDMIDSSWSDEQFARLWGLQRWMEETVSTHYMHETRISAEVLMRAYKSGFATSADLYGELLMTHYSNARGSYYSLQMLRDLTRRKVPLLDEHPALKIAVTRSRERIVEIELRRGEQPTAATVYAAALYSLPGVSWFVRLMSGLSHRDLERKNRSGQSRSVVLSRLLSVTHPAEGDTPEALAEAMKTSRIPERLIVQSALLAPQWAEWLEPVIGWKGFADAVWWIHAHTKDTRWFVDEDLREEWAAAISRRTPLASADLLDGAVDVGWFYQAHDTIGAERWGKLYDAAKYATGGVGHTRAKLFADALLGKLDVPALLTRITDKRHQDSVRALGLLPLPDDFAAREQEVLNRYQSMQEFLRTARKFGAQRRTNETRAVEIGMDNLARTAGYTDPVRLQWAMEARESADLAGGKLAVERDGVVMTLTLSVVGKPEITITRDGKRLKTLPAAFKKDEAFVGLRERRGQIERQFSRMRLSLENAMIREDRFGGTELIELSKHPILNPMLEQLVFTSVDDPTLMGFPVDGGTGLIRYDGAVTPISPNATLRIAHAIDLYRTGNWSLWQRDCFVNERIQPFKQVFRELYLLTDAERAEGNLSRRYSGHQIQPRQAAALFGARGWITDPEGGTTKTFHALGLTAAVGYLYGYGTSVEVEGATVENVYFYKAGQWLPIPLNDVPAITFSEVMRDLDLVVSVAHRGGVDPEATASTVEMRTTLIHETCAMLKVGNVSLKGNYALVEGKLGSYSVHLGSAMVHRQPGGALCIIPVHAQHRGRIFLPFADSDPKTAEVISKVILLARDEQIKDPTILEQIFAGA